MKMSLAIEIYRLFARLVQPLAYLGLLVGSLFSHRWRTGWRERLGFIPAVKRTDKKRVLVHAASVGEVETVWQLVKKLSQTFEVAVSTLTPTGRLAASKKGGITSCFLFPLDAPKFVKRALERIKPDLVIIAETEIWPCFIYELKKRKVPFVFVNARISDRTFKWYRRLRSFFKPLLSGAALIWAQSHEHESRFANLGIDSKRLKVFGNFKLDVDLESLKARAIALKEELVRFVSFDKPVIVFASTHRGEEALLLPVISSVKSSALCIIVPRHPERAGEVAKLFEKEGVDFSLLSSGKPHPEVLIVDAIGKLLFFYERCLCAFVGGSLVRIGGHNIAEPIAFGKPAIFGPHIFNFRDSANTFLSANAAVMVNDTSELLQAIKGFLNDPESAHKIGRRAQKALEEHNGTTERSYRAIYDLLDGSLKSS